MIKNYVHKPAISVIIPMYNSERFIAQCLSSVLIQTFKDFEVIVVDDCSEDKSVALTETFVELFNGRLNLIELKKNTGCPGEPRNVGIMHAKGKYIYFLDSDDVLVPTALEELFKYTEDKELDLIHSEKNFVPLMTDDSNNFKYNEDINENTKFRTIESMAYDKPTLETNDPAERIIRFSEKRFWTTVWRNLIRRDLIVNNKLSFINTRILEDDVFTFECLCCANKVLHIPNIFYIYRMRKSSISHDSLAREVGTRIDTMIKIFKALDDFMNNMKIFTEQPELRYKVFDFFMKKLTRPLRKVPPYELDSLLRKKFSENPSANIPLLTYSFGMMNQFRNASECEDV